MGTRDNDELYEAELRNRIAAKIDARTNAVMAGDGPTINGLTDSFADYIIDVQSAGSLLRAALCAPDTAGPELQRILKDVMHADAEAEAIHELTPAPRFPIGDNTRAALDAVGRALQTLAA